MATTHTTNERASPVPSDNLKLNRMNSLRRRISSTSSQQNMYSRVNDGGAGGGEVGIDSFYDNSEYGDFDEKKYNNRGSWNSVKLAVEGSHLASNAEENEEDEEESIYTAMRTVASLSTKGTFDSCFSATVGKGSTANPDADTIEEETKEAVEDSEEAANVANEVAKSPAAFSAAIDEDDCNGDFGEEATTRKYTQKPKEDGEFQQHHQSTGDNEEAITLVSAKANKSSSKAITTRTLPSPATVASRRFTGTRSSKSNNISVRVNAKAKMESAIADGSDAMEDAIASATANSKIEGKEKKKKTGSSARVKMMGAITALSGYLSDGAGGTGMDGEGTTGSRKNKKKLYRKRKKAREAKEKLEAEGEDRKDIAEKEVFNVTDPTHQNKEREEDEQEGGNVDYNHNNDTPNARSDKNPANEDEGDAEDENQCRNASSFDHLHLNNSMESIPQFTPHKKNCGETPSKDGTECTSPASTSASEHNHEDDPTPSSLSPSSPVASTKKNKKKEKAVLPSSKDDPTKKEKEEIPAKNETAGGLTKSKSRKINLLPKLIKRKSLFRRKAEESKENKNAEESIKAAHGTEVAEFETFEQNITRNVGSRGSVQEDDKHLVRGSAMERISHDKDALEEKDDDEDSADYINANSATDANESMSFRKASELVPKNLLPFMVLSEEEEFAEVDREGQDEEGEEEDQDEIEDQDDIQSALARSLDNNPSYADSVDGPSDQDIVISLVSVIEPSMEIDPNTDFPNVFPALSHDEAIAAVSLDGSESQLDDYDLGDEDKEHFEVEWDFDHGQPVVINGSFLIDESQEHIDAESRATAEGEDDGADLDDEDDEQPSVVPNATSMGSVSIVVNHASTDLASEWQADFSQLDQSVKLPKRDLGNDAKTTANNLGLRVDEISWPSEVDHANNQEVVESDFRRHFEEVEPDGVAEDAEFGIVSREDEVSVKKEKLPLKAMLSLKELHAASKRHAASKSVKSFCSNPSANLGMSTRKSTKKSSKKVLDDDEVPVLPPDVVTPKIKTANLETSKLEPSKLEPKLSYKSRRRMEELLNPNPTALSAPSIDERFDEKTIMSENESVSLNDNNLGFQDIATSCTNGIRQFLDIVDYAFASNGDEDDSESFESSDEESDRYRKDRSRKSSSRHRSRQKLRQESRGDRRTKSRGSRSSKHHKARKSRTPQETRRYRRRSRSRSQSSSPERDDGNYRTKSRDRHTRNRSVSPVEDDVTDDSEHFRATSPSPKRTTKRSTKMRSFSPVSLMSGGEKLLRQEAETQKSSMTREQDEKPSAARNLAKARQSALFRKTKSKKYKQHSTHRSAREF
mmetsp:Transcript_12591/g.26478  ORF Transcript_12591/g.26478 Transcript_12591/m.26478 type:complete len:1320 (+) Transcript_12591:274-4233(+)